MAHAPMSFDPRAAIGLSPLDRRRAGAQRRAAVRRRLYAGDRVRQRRLLRRPPHVLLAALHGAHASDRLSKAAQLGHLQSARFLPTVVAVLLLALPASARPLPIVLPDARNLQYLDFWVALGAHYFDDEGLALELRTPPTPGEVTQLLHADDSQIAILPPPIFLQMIADGFPLRVIANLLINDPIDLIVRRSIMAERHLSLRASLAQRLGSLRGLRIGVAPGPVTRLHMLFRAAGLDVDEVMKVVILMGPEQNDAFAQNRVDVLYAHTPFLERALVQQDAVLLINQSAGEVPELAARQIHALVATRAFVAREPKTLIKLARALLRAAALIHTDQAAATAAVLRAVPGTTPELVRQIVAVYAPAVPRVPAVTAEGVHSSLSFFPASKRPPDMSRVDWPSFVAPRFVEAAQHTR